MRFEISFRGHKNVRSLHPKSIEITTESDLTVNGDCIVGVNASCGCLGIPDEMKTLLQKPQSEITCTILVGNHSFKVKGRGSAKLALTNPHDIVIRKSNFTCPRTLSIGCDTASDSIPRQIVDALQNPETVGIFRIEIK
ncbi:DUF371 domain-containing protein [Candidatus Nitrosotalea bavarica]|jgi:hypothetical protein|uniref:DUF371 domain-containing protein n=1 Tax=Candidatus Nitrosotalea bavarica TaxID=1903277 RepID=UPI000C7010D3|nr:DUF371 domain-containing protein [Candidatus Nitrosotalea bavarica]